MDFDGLLERCNRDQWKVGDLDWSARPREMSRDDEVAIVQLFTDMAAIERLAGALFLEQERRATDPKAKAIFASFVKDEVRHSHAAQMLADFYDVHHFKQYAVNPHLAKFTPHFVNAVRYLSDEIANAYITGGELILDIALLRSINDYVSDAMSARAMELINRDESRHIAMDFHMVGHYASDAYRQSEAARPRRSLRDQMIAWWTFANVIYYGKPFFRAVFFEPMERIDPSGTRIREAIKRFQLLGAKPGVADRPFSRFMKTLQNLHNHPVAGRILGGVTSRLAGLDDRFMAELATETELAAARAKSFDTLAQEALAAKHAV